MSEKRMFTKLIVDSDAFLDMPMSTQALYFHLGMRADDEGFINNPKKIIRMIGASNDELKVLLSKRFVLGFETGVIVIKHWKMHNWIRQDRLKPTVNTQERSSLKVKENGSYTECLPSVRQVSDKSPHRLVKSSLEEISIDKEESDKPLPTLPYYSISLSTLIFSHSRTIKTKAQINAGAKIINDLERIDGYSPDEIKSVIEWALNDSFWSANVQSPAKLRHKSGGIADNTKFDKIYKQWEKDKKTAIKKRIEFNNTALFPQSYKNGKVCVICDNTQIVNGVKCPCVNYDYVPLEHWDEWMKHYKDVSPISYNDYLKR